MIYTITFNPALDYILNVSDLSSKDINRALREEICFGGKGINASVVLSRLGVPNKALGFLAGFSGAQLEAMLKDENVNTDFVFLKSGYTRINVKIRSDRELDINANGPQIAQEDVAALFEKLNELKDDDYLVLAGSVPSSLPSDIYEKMMYALSDRRVHFVVDAEGDLLKNVLKYKPFLIKPNHHELGAIFSVHITSEQDAVFYAKELQKMGARNVIVSRAENGAVLVDEFGNAYSVGTAKGEFVSSVGCGDSMVAGFIAGYLADENYENALRLGAACGNAAAFSTSLPRKEDIENLIKNNALNVKKI